MTNEPGFDVGDNAAEGATAGPELAASKLLRTFLIALSVVTLCSAAVAALAGGAWIPFSVAVAIAAGGASLLVTVRVAQWMFAAVPALVGGLLLITGPSPATRILGAVLLGAGLLCMLMIARGGAAPGRDALARFMSFAIMHPRDQRRFKFFDWMRR